MGVGTRIVSTRAAVPSLGHARASRPCQARHTANGKVNFAIALWSSGLSRTGRPLPRSSETRRWWSPRGCGGPRADVVRNDDRLGMRLVVDYLVAAGHTAVAHLGGLGGAVAEERLAHLAAAASTVR